MPDLTEAEVSAWLDEHATVFQRAIEKIERLVEFFLNDWATIWEFSYEQIEGARVKSASRVFAKAQRRGLDRPEELLERGFRKAERNRFPVHDLLGVRVLVRSLNDVDAVRTALENLQAGQGELYPFGNAEDFDLEDINKEPRPGGYRALHIDGSVTVSVGSTDDTLPFEVQIKTLAQHVYGQHTHDEAYVPDDANADARYQLVKALQTALAEQLHAADLLLAQIEDVAGQVRDEIARNEAGPEISSASIANAVREKTGYKLRAADADKVTERARAAGLQTAAQFAELIDLSGDAAAAAAETFAADHRRRPTVPELIDTLLHSDDNVLAGETDEDRARLAAHLASQDPPSDPLDELDPEADIAVSADESDEAAGD